MNAKRTGVALAVALVASAVAAVGATGALASGGSARGQDRVGTYQVTLTNLTTGQPFSPPYLATSRSRDTMFELGRPASSALQEVAENGDTALTMRNFLVQAKARGDVFDWAGGPPPGAKPLAPAGTPGATGNAVDSAGHPIGPCSALNFACPPTESLTVHAREGDRLSLSTMLVCTNDGFVGLAGARLPERVGQTLTYDSPAYDTGTEIDTQNFEDLMPWCQTIDGVYDPTPHPLPGNPFGPLSGQVTTNPALAEGGVVSLHSGIQPGVGELSAIHTWQGPVARIDVTRVG